MAYFAAYHKVLHSNANASLLSYFQEQRTFHLFSATKINEIEPNTQA